LHYVPVLEVDPEEVRGGLSEHMLLTIQVARNAAGKVRPGGALLFMGGNRRSLSKRRRDRVGGHHGDAGADRKPCARAGAGPSQPDRRRLRRQQLVPG
jgi:hypothetical protein